VTEVTESKGCLDLHSRAMSVDLGAWEMRAVVDVATHTVNDDALQAIRDELYQRASGSSIFGQAIPDQYLVERLASGVLLKCRLTAVTETETWIRALTMVQRLVFSHPKAQSWFGISVRRIEVRLTAE
jgi:hypothetical protein